ncbi:MAG: ABC transporter permease subunit [Oscillospiraceae bacterium]|nr:ABC transporter permease subunit [Oscillospiraceae bacterium]
MKNRTVLPNLYIGVLLALTYVPILLVIIYSFNASRISSMWSGFSISWYGALLRDRSIFDALRNSVVLATLASVCAAVVGTLGAVGMSRVKWKANGAVEYISILPIMIPEIILGMVFIVFFALIGIPFGFPALVVGHTMFCIPYVFLMVKARLAGMDKSYIEAAKDLGASELRAFYDITFPLLRPAIISGMLLSFAMSMDDVIISMFLTNAESNTLPLKIYTQLRTGVTPKTNALCALMFAFTLLMGGLSFWVGRRAQNRD